MSVEIVSENQERTKAGSLIVPAGSLVVGDRVEMKSVATAEKITAVADMLAATRARSTSSTAVAVAPAAPVMAPGLVTFTPEQLALLKRQICKPKNRDATNDELALFVGQCKRRSLDPFAGQIYAVFRYDTGEKREVMTVQTGIDGFRLIAERTRKYLGAEAVLWCGSDGIWQDVWLDSGNPVASKVIVRKLMDGHIAPTPGIAKWSEYAVDEFMWRKMPANQLAKCAEALALRRAFPNDLSGIYTADEMAQADAQPLAIAGVAEPEPQDAEVVADAAAARSDGIDVSVVRRALDGAGIDEQTELMLLGSVGVETLDELTPATLAELQQAITEHIAGGAS